MSTSMELRALAEADAAAPPFGFEEFERRRVAALRRRRATGLSVAASVAVLGVVSLSALLTQAPEPVTLLTEPAATAAASNTRYELPALVDLDQFEVTSELEDRIALLDAEISAARVQAVPVEQLRQMEVTRAQMNDSLQRVSYAHSLLSL
jgi:uncharacterized small protein (DUF1192 family)